MDQYVGLRGRNRKSQTIELGGGWRGERGILFHEFVSVMFIRRDFPKLSTGHWRLPLQHA